MFCVAVPSAAAQGPFQPVSLAQAEIQQTSPAKTVAVGAKEIYTGKFNLKSVINPNSKVLNVTEIKGDPKSVLLEALAAGTHDRHRSSMRKTTRRSST